MLQTRVSQPRLSNSHAVNGYLPPLGAPRACEAAARLMRIKAAKAGSNRSLVSGVL
jgi:hypothetical protein